MLELIENGANINVGNEQGATPLHLAALNGNWKNMTIFYSRFSKEKHPFITGSFAIVDSLIKHGANVSATALLNITPLHLSICRGNSNFFLIPKNVFMHKSIKK